MKVSDVDMSEVIASKSDKPAPHRRKTKPVVLQGESPRKARKEFEL